MSDLEPAQGEGAAVLENGERGAGERVHLAVRCPIGGAGSRSRGIDPWIPQASDPKWAALEDSTINGGKPCK